MTNNWTATYEADFGTHSHENIEIPKWAPLGQVADIPTVVKITVEHSNGYVERFERTPLEPAWAHLPEGLGER